MKSVSLDKVFFLKKKLEHGLEGNIPSGLRSFLFFFYFLFLILNKFVLKKLISRGVSYLVNILSGVGNIFLLDCSQILFLLNVESRGISKPHKSLVQRGEYCYK